MLPQLNVNVPKIEKCEEFAQVLAQCPVIAAICEREVGRRLPLALAIVKVLNTPDVKPVASSLEKVEKLLEDLRECSSKLRVFTRDNRLAWEFTQYKEAELRTGKDVFTDVLGIDKFHEYGFCSLEYAINKHKFNHRTLSGANTNAKWSKLKRLPLVALLASKQLVKFDANNIVVGPTEGGLFARYRMTSGLLKTENDKFATLADAFSTPVTIELAVLHRVQ